MNPSKRELAAWTNARVVAGLMIIGTLFAIGLTAAEVVTNPFEGVRLTARTETIPRPVALHIAEIDLGAPGIRFKLTPPGGTRDAVRQTTLDFLEQEKAQLAINVHFYYPFSTPDTNANLIGLAASEGTVYSPFEPQPIGADYPDQSYAILPYAPALNIDRSNRVTIVHRDPAQADNKHVIEPGGLWTAVAGSAQIVTDGVKTIPSYSGSPFGLNPLYYSDDFSWYEVLHARSAIGLTEDKRTLVLFTVDEAGGSFGMTVGEVADLLIQDYKVFDALNLDGDGSTTMAMEDPQTGVGRLFNISDDGPLGRAVGSNLAVFARARTEPISLVIWLAADKKRVVISWRKDGQSWKLQSKSSLAQDKWDWIGVEPEEAGELMEVTLPILSERSFYRLTR